MPQGTGTYGKKRGRPPKKSEKSCKEKEIKEIDLTNQKIIHSDV